MRREKKRTKTETNEPSCISKQNITIKGLKSRPKVNKVEPKYNF